MMDYILLNGMGWEALPQASPVFYLFLLPSLSNAACHRYGLSYYYSSGCPPSDMTVLFASCILRAVSPRRQKKKQSAYEV